MEQIIIYTLVAVIVYLTHVQEGITGFGCTVLALPFITLLLGLQTAVPMLVINAWVLTVYITWESRQKIVWSEYARIFILAALGLPIGMWMSSRLPEDILKFILAGFMILVGIHGLWKQTAKQRNNPTVNPTTRFLSSLLLPIGGLIHGAFGSGGPLAVIYATQTLTDKTAFRGTLCAVWVTLNTIIVSRWIVTKSLNAHILKVAAFALPFTVIGMIMGNHWHYRMDEILFRKLVYTVLVLAGITLALSVIV
ncbi:MAG: sulfite exporter TauE/SafE family protein [Armatimonadota bacterium]|nr:sulfite exporter TauE/SafE family protein [Armatimonadota bacterium]